MHVRRAVLAILVLALVAAAAAAANLALLRSTENSSDPVGRLSPRAVFAPATPAGSSVPVPTRTNRHEQDD